MKIVWYLLAGVVIVLDQYTKTLAVDNLVYGQPVPVFPVLNWTLLHNPGAAWSFLADAGGWQHWLLGGIALVVSAVLVVWIWRLPEKQRFLPIALALVLGGALGNFWDRVTLGYVIDFISVHWNDAYFPAFNIADSAISCGAVMLVIDSLFFQQDDQQEGEEQGEQESHQKQGGSAVAREDQVVAQSKKDKQSLQDKQHANH